MRKRGFNLVLGAVLLVVLLLSGMRANDYYLYVANLTLINAMVAIGLVVLAGVGGQLSLGTAALLPGFTAVRPARRTLPNRRLDASAFNRNRDAPGVPPRRVPIFPTPGSNPLGPASGWLEGLEQDLDAREDHRSCGAHPPRGESPVQGPGSSAS